MEQNYSSTKLPTVGTASAASNNGINWSNPSRITTDDGSSAVYNSVTFGGDHGATITGSAFGFQQLPPSAVIDGIQVNIDGSQSSAYGSVILNVAGSTPKDIGTLNTSYGSSTDLWGLDSISLAEIAALSVSVDANDVSGGDGSASIDHLSVTVFWHIEMPQAADADIPTRFDYKVYSNDGTFLGLLPKVTSKFGFAQDISSAGTAVEITCGKFVKNEVTVSPLLTEAGDVITTEDDLPILATETEILIARGNSVDNAIFKNGNRVKVWMYNRYYPNGKLMFSGQVNRVGLKYGGADASVKLTVYSDGLDLNNFIARGYPFSYTTDVTQSSQNGYVVNVMGSGAKDPGWDIYGQTWKSGAAANNLGQVVLKLRGSGTVNLSIYDAPNGNLLGSISKSFSAPPTGSDISFDLASLIDITPLTTYFLVPWASAGQNFGVFSHTSSATYADGSMYRSQYSGGSGGGSFVETTGDFYFITKYGTPTTTTTYSSDDPVSEMAHGILLDYNARGGFITERDFEATGLSLTYTFVVATILDALKKILELCPDGYYMNVDLGTAELDIKQMSETADFTVVRGRHIAELDLGLSIEQVKNYLLLSGGETAGVNLYRDYADTESQSFYGLRTATLSDNRVTVAATANAIGDSFIDENSDESQETTLIVKDEHVDITQFVPGKTIGFKNFGNLVDDSIMQIVRREPNFSDGIAVLTLGRLPIRTNDEVQRLRRGLLNQQTINNPSAPS